MRPTANPRAYCKFAVDAADVPVLFTRVTVTEVIAPGLPVVNGCVYVKLLPNWFEAEL